MIIYKITNSINGKIYIGQTIRTLNERISEHKRINKHENQYLKNAILKYGFDSFIFEIIDTGLSINELNSKEKYWIEFYNSTNRNLGYNILDGGRNSLLAIETKEKMSMSRSGKKQTYDWIKNRIAKAGSLEAKKYGHKKTKEEIEHLRGVSSKYWLGKSRSKKTKELISKTKKFQSVLPPNSKKVDKINALTNSVIKTYESTNKAALDNPQFSQSTISRRCNNQLTNKGNIHWRFTKI